MSGAVAALEWDSGFFGFGVAALALPDADRASLALLLERCHEAGFRLVYWFAREGRSEDGSILAGFEGRLVDRRITFARPPAAPPADGSESWIVEEEPPGPASEPLQRLALSAGAFSRFRIDPGVPAGKFEQLYLAWIDRSARREIADAVLVARGRRGILGMVTIEKQPGEARIGLIAVDAPAQGLGVGRSLMAAADRWAVSAGAERIAVVTQEANEAACRFYARSGYRAEEVRYVHHFWRQGDGA